jgi:hypothetical protein
MIEISNAILMVLFLYYAAFAVFYLVSKVRDKSRYYGGWGYAIRSVYREQKPAVSITFTATGLFLHILPLWYLRHAVNHNWALSATDEEIAHPTVWLGTVLTAVGIMCWIRVMSPFQNRNLMWVLMVAFAVGFSLSMALL